MKHFCDVSGFWFRMLPVGFLCVRSNLGFVCVRSHLAFKYLRARWRRIAFVPLVSYLCVRMEGGGSRASAVLSLSLSLSRARARARALSLFLF